MRVEKRVILTQDEKEQFNKVSTLITKIWNNMTDEDELEFVDNNCVMHVLTINELEEVSWLLSNMVKLELEII